MSQKMPTFPKKAFEMPRWQHCKGTKGAITLSETSVGPPRADLPQPVLLRRPPAVVAAALVGRAQQLPGRHQGGGGGEGHVLFLKK